MSDDTGNIMNNDAPVETAPALPDQPFSTPTSPLPAPITPLFPHATTTEIDPATGRPLGEAEAQRPVNRPLPSVHNRNQGRKNAHAPTFIAAAADKLSNHPGKNGLYDLLLKEGNVVTPSYADIGKYIDKTIPPHLPRYSDTFKGVTFMRIAPFTTDDGALDELGRLFSKYKLADDALKIRGGKVIYCPLSTVVPSFQKAQQDHEMRLSFARPTTLIILYHTPHFVVPDIKSRRLDARMNHHVLSYKKSQIRAIYFLPADTIGHMVAYSEGIKDMIAKHASPAYPPIPAPLESFRVHLPSKPGNKNAHIPSSGATAAIGRLPAHHIDGPFLPEDKDATTTASASTLESQQEGTNTDTMGKGKAAQVDQGGSLGAATPIKLKHAVHDGSPEHAPDGALKISPDAKRPHHGAAAE